RRLTDHSGTSALTCTGLKRWKRPKRSLRTGGGTTTRIGLTRLSTTCRQPNLYAGRAFQALSRFNQGRKLLSEWPWKLKRIRKICNVLGDLSIKLGEAARQI